MERRITLKPNINFILTEKKPLKPRLAVGKKVEWHRSKNLYTACTRCHSRLSLVSVDDEKSCLICGHAVYNRPPSPMDIGYGGSHR